MLVNFLIIIHISDTTDINSLIFGSEYQNTDELFDKPAMLLYSLLTQIFAIEVLELRVFHHLFVLLI
jgi:hypothetical protein